MTGAIDIEAIRTVLDGLDGIADGMLPTSWAMNTITQLCDRLEELEPEPKVKQVNTVWVAYHQDPMDIIDAIFTSELEARRYAMDNYKQAAEVKLEKKIEL